MPVHLIAQPNNVPISSIINVSGDSFVKESRIMDTSEDIGLVCKGVRFLIRNGSVPHMPICGLDCQPYRSSLIRCQAMKDPTPSYPGFGMCYHGAITVAGWQLAASTGSRC